MSWFDEIDKLTLTFWPIHNTYLTRLQYFTPSRPRITITNVYVQLLCKIFFPWNFNNNPYHLTCRKRFIFFFISMSIWKKGLPILFQTCVPNQKAVKAKNALLMNSWNYPPRWVRLDLEKRWTWPFHDSTILQKTNFTFCPALLEI